MRLPAASCDLFLFFSPASSIALPFFSISAPRSFSALAAFSSALPRFSIRFPSASAGLVLPAMASGDANRAAPANNMDRRFQDEAIVTSFVVCRGCGHGIPRCQGLARPRLRRRSGLDLDVDEADVERQLRLQAGDDDRGLLDGRPRRERRPAG